MEKDVLQHQTVVHVFNWYAKNKRLTKGLKELFKKSIGERPVFVTMRLGTKWAERLNPGDKVAVSISDNVSKNPNVIGYVRVRMVKKCIIAHMSDDDKDLQNNIGAKAWYQVLKDMQSVYGATMVSFRSIITIIEFMVDE